MILSLTSLTKETTVCINCQERGRGRHRAAKSGSWQVVGEFQPTTFTSKLRDIIRLAATKWLASLGWNIFWYDLLEMQTWLSGLISWRLGLPPAPEFEVV